MAILDRGITRYILADMMGQSMYNGKRDPNAHKGNGNSPQNYYMRDFKNAERFRPNNTPVRQKFNGYVNFTFNSEVDVDFLNDVDFRNNLSSLVRSADFPSAEFQTDVKNQYNKKRITVSGVQYKPISITAYDTVDSLWVILLMKMYSHLFTNPTNKFDSTQGQASTPKYRDYDVVPQIVPSGDGSSTSTSFNRPFGSNDAGLNLQPGSQRNFITQMDVVQYHAQRAIRYTLFNPLITTFTIDPIDHGDSQVSTIQMNIEYENFTVNPDVNFFITEDELKRFSNYNANHWQALRSGTSDQADVPGGSIAGKIPTAMKDRKVEFLNNVERTAQVSFLDSFKNAEEVKAEDKRATPATQRSSTGPSI